MEEKLKQLMENHDVLTNWRKKTGLWANLKEIFSY